MIPKNIHFIYFGFTEFELIHYISIRSAIEVHQPDRTFLYYSKEPRNNKLWDEIKTKVELVKVDPPTEYGGVELKSYQYKADVLRLQKLIELGGAYMDIDVISLKPFGDLWNKSCVLGIESAADHFNSNIDQARSITNAVILAEPNHPFIVEWLSQTATNLKDKPWAYHAVCLPVDILKQQNYDVHVEPQNSFMPFDFREGWIFGPANSKKNTLATSYTMHLWETIWMDKLRGYDVEKIQTVDNLFCEVCRPYLPDTKLKIAVYTIAKNEADYVDRWAATNTEADIRIVCDTGSTDGTVDRLKQHGVTVYDIAVTPWRFDMARNTALNLVPADVDICIWQDLDEELLPGWRHELEKVWNKNTTTVNHKYRHNNNAWQWHSKIHARHNCIWTGAVHETLKWNIPEETAWAPEFYLDEHQNVNKPRSSYLNLLLKKIDEGDRNWRTYYFLANDYQNIGDFENSVKYRELSYQACAGDGLLQGYVARNLARQYADKNDYVTAEKWFRTSVDHSEERESWFYYCEYFYKRQKWDECFIAAKKCMSVTTKRDGFTYDPIAWGFMAYDYAAIAAYHMQLYSQAVEFGKLALERLPNDQRLLSNQSFYEEKVPVPVPDVLTIETAGNCNRTCGTCIRNSEPDRDKVASWFTDTQLDMELIVKIFEDAKAMGYDRDLCLSFYNEPTMDPRIADIAELARNYPFRNIFMHSNGDFITEELAAKLDGKFTFIVFSIYANEQAKANREEQIKSWFKQTQVRFTTGVHMATHYSPLVNMPEVLDLVKDMNCTEPLDRLIINHKGEMTFCCDDLNGNFDLGSVKDNTLYDLWFSPKHQRLAKQLKKEKGRHGLPFCETCPRPYTFIKNKDLEVKNIPIKKL